MQTSDHGFEQIMSAVLEQKQVWEKLQTENRELRQQLVDLRAGRGIFIEVMNQRFELAWESSKVPTELLTTSPVKKNQNQPMKGAKEAALSPAIAPSGILEEMLLEELSSAMHNHSGVSPENLPTITFNDEQKANLRRELSGSFLLE